MIFHRLLRGGELGIIDGKEIKVAPYLCAAAFRDAVNAALVAAHGPDLYTFGPYSNYTGYRLLAVDPAPGVWEFSQAWKWFSGETRDTATKAVGTMLIESGTQVAWTPALAALLGPSRRSWTRGKSPEPGSGCLARVLDTQTFFDLRLWLTVADRPRGAELLEHPFGVLPDGSFEAQAWTELNPTGTLLLRVSDASGAMQPQMIGSNASVLQYQMEVVRICV